MTGSYTVHQTRIINAPIKTVWDAWTQPSLMKQWFCPLGMNVADVEADLKVGGTFRVVMDPGDLDIQRPPGLGKLLVAHGTYRLIYPPETLIFSWSWEGRDEVSRVSIGLKQIGDQTEVSLLHDGLESEDCRVFHEDGWVPTLDNLSRYIVADADVDTSKATLEAYHETL